jgi:hypothetical protein
MKSVNQITLDENAFYASTFLKGYDGTVPYDLPTASYDFDHATFETIGFLESVFFAFESKDAMASLFFMNRIDEATFHSLRVALNGVVRGKDRNEIAELDQAIMALSLHMRSHPAYAEFYAADERKTLIEEVLADVAASSNDTFNCRTGYGPGMIKG